MYSSEPENYLLLLSVFHRGLLNGLVSKADVVKWADAIILAEDEPDYFFIEIAVAPDVNSIIEIIGNLSLQYEPVTERVLLGLLYLKVKQGLIEPRKTAFILDKINAMDALSGEERNELYELSDDFERKYGMEFFGEWEADVLRFLSDYESFTLDNVAVWGTINAILDARVNAIDQERQQRYEKSVKINQLKVKKQATATKITLAVVVLFALFTVTTTYIRLQNHQFLTKFQHNLYSICILVVSLFVCYQIVKQIYKQMQRAVKK
jgi:hypothetical protein